ncbi:PEGA domain-containing protein [Enhygromyxa salina]|uniref:PEGA domain protein n=1 Tax=Enhygromyxa salina TaxID=215803 RepID=A0A2S9XU14_9BACT|nr:PEGA domain-containing protein [Enhygromyxa salina]PRP96356.1 PEGA domain protein [Enhygromyxa salina]
MVAACATATALALGLAQAPVAFAAPPDGSAESSASSTDVAGKAAILPLVVDGDLPDADRDTLTGQLVEGLQRGSFEIVTPDQVAAVAGSGDCDKPGCMKKIAGQTGATHIVRATVQVVDRDYSVRVELFDGSDGTKIVSASEGCEICGVVDVGGLMQTQAATLRTKLDALASGPAAVNITSDPEGAEVTLDGEVFGTTPVDKPLIPGDHVIRVSKDGYISVQEKRTFVEGARETLSYELEKVPNRLPKRPWGYASLGVGIAAVGGSLALTYLDYEDFRIGGACKGENVDFEGDCRHVFNTKWYGVGLGLAGGALVTLGVAILISTAKSPRKQAKIEAAAKHLQVGPGGVGVRF